MRTTTWAVVWTAARSAMALAITAAIVAQLVETVGNAADLGRDVPATIANFFSFFTILSNTATAAVLLWAACWFWTRGRPRDATVEPPVLAVALACVTTYMVITGIVYNVLLRGVELLPGDEPVWWSNEVMHLVGPLFLLADVFAGPHRRALPWRVLWVVVAFPIGWAVYTMIRGALVINPVSGNATWYPYPFLNPANFDNGYLGVSLYIVGIAVAIVTVGTFVVWWGRRVGAMTEAVSAPK